MLFLRGPYHSESRSPNWFLSAATNSEKAFQSICIISDCELVRFIFVHKRLFFSLEALRFNYDNPDDNET